MKTFSAKPTDVKREWYILDASQTTMGRLATKSASLLIGKGKPQFTSHIDCGDYVIIINAANAKVTGNKLQAKKYYRHSGYPGGIKMRTLAESNEIDPTIAIEKAVRGMLPVNKLRPGRLERLKIYAGAEHHHQAQTPKELSFKEGK